MVTFIAGVINTTYESESKTKRIQILAKAVRLKWKINEELRVQCNQEMPCIGY